MKMNRRKFLRTSSGLFVSAAIPGIWSCKRITAKKQKYNFEPFKGESLAPVLKVTPDDGYYVHTYFDVTPFSPTQRYLAVSRLPFQDRIPKLGDTASVCVIDLHSETIETVYTTKAWGFQTGTNVQWGASDRYVYTNDFIDGKAVAVQIDLESDNVTIFDTSMYHVAFDGSSMIGFPLKYLNVTQQGYGLPSSDNTSPIKLPIGAATDEGIWRIDLHTGKIRLLYSLADVAAKIPEPPPEKNGTYYFWHSKFNRQGTRIMQVLRCLFPGGWGGRNPMVFTLNSDGSNVKFTKNFPVWGCSLGGHPNWHPDGEHIIRNMKPYGEDTYLCQMKFDGSDFKILSEKFKSSGHPSIHPDNQYIMTDRWTRDDGRQKISLILFDQIADESVTITTMPTIDRQGLTGIRKTLRLDGHPVWSRDYKRVSFQAAVDGNRQLFIIDLSKIIG